MRFSRVKIVTLATTAILAFAFVSTLKIGTIVANPATSIEVSPASQDVIKNNDCTVYIDVKDVTHLYAWEFQLNYDKDKLDLTSTAIVSGGLATPTQTFQSLTNETTGHLWWAVSTTYPNTTGISYASHHIFEIHFHAIAAGDATLDLHDTVLSDNTGTAIAHTDVDGTVSVKTRDLTVTNIKIDDLGCNLYKNDTHANGTPYFYPVEVTVHNTGTAAAESFHVKLEVFYGAVSKGSAELVVASLAAGANATVNFTSLFHPMDTTPTTKYKLTATVDSQTEVVEDNESNNTLDKTGIEVTVMGDINGDGTVNILDAVVMALVWTATPSDVWWNIKADINHDGVIDIYDGTRIGLHWGETK
jgi:hypothetical protein